MKSITNTTTESFISSSLNRVQLYKSDPGKIDWYDVTVLLLNDVILLDAKTVLLLGKFDNVFNVLLRDLFKHQSINGVLCTQNTIIFAKYTIKNIMTMNHVERWDLRNCFGIFYNIYKFDIWLVSLFFHMSFIVWKLPV